MIQAVMTAPGKIRFRDVPTPEIRSDQVLIKIIRIGICGSDIHVFHGNHPFTSYPVVQGHEVSGKIIAVGSDVKNLKCGDKITVQPQIYCGHCYSCIHGKYNICDNLKVMGFQTTGSASEFFAVDAVKVLKLPESMSFEQGAMVEPLAVAVHALGRTTAVKGKKILVLGAGPIGNLVAQTAQALGAEMVLITDISDFRLTIAGKCGIAFQANPEKEDLEKVIIEKFNAYKADLILECVGINPAIEQAISLARKGTDIVVVGVFGEKPCIDMGLVQDRELRLIGTLMYQKKDFLAAIELIYKNKVVLSPF
jgi:L-iditol 2-dehydrogenase